MRGIEQRNVCIYYYGSPAGYIDSGEQAVLDAMFRSDELESFAKRSGLAVQWTDGVYDRLISGAVMTPQGEAAAPLKSCRICQLKPEAGAWAALVSPGKPLPVPKLEDYRPVYDGQIETNDLEAIYDKFGDRAPNGFSGHPLAVSDIVELYDSGGSSFYHLGRTQFKEIAFEPEMPSQDMALRQTSSP